MKRVTRTEWLGLAATVSVLATATWLLQDRVRFLQPMALLLLPVLLWVWLIGRRSLGGLGVWTRRVVLAARLLAVMLVILALADLQARRESSRLAVHFVLDQSKSMPRQREQILQYMRAQAEKRRPGDQFALAVFGRNYSPELPFSDGDFPIQNIGAFVNENFTDVGQAIARASAMFDEGFNKRIVVFTDGNDNVGRALEEARNAAARDIHIDVYPTPYRVERDVWVEKIVVPPDVKVGETFPVTVVVGSTHPTRARLDIKEGGRPIVPDNADGAAGWVVELDGEPRKNVFTFQRKLTEPTAYKYEAEVTTLGETDETRTQNNLAETFTWVRGKSRVLIVAPTPAESRHLRDAIAGQKIYVEERSPDQLPVSASDINSYDCIIVVNVESRAFVDRQHMAAFQNAVRHSGAGLIMIGGEDSFGAGGYDATPIEETLPVNMEIKMRKVIPSTAVVLVLDVSGSMQGQKLQLGKAAAIAAVQTLRQGDYIGVVVFSARTHWQVPLQEVTDREAIADKIRNIGSGGGTNLFPAMSTAHAALTRNRAASQHMIILSDGRTTGSGYEELAKRIAANGISISCVAVGRDADMPLMESIARIGGGRFHMTTSPQQVPQIFAQEVQMVRRRNFVANEPFVPSMVDYTEPLRGFSPGDFPQLLAWVVTTPKARAAVPLQAVYGGDPGPLLAHWQYGLGRAVAFTSDATGNWAKQWVTWAGFDKFWTQVVQWTARRRPESDLEIVTRIVGGTGEVVVEAFGDDGEPIDGLDLRAFVKYPMPREGREGRQLRLRQVAPGRYEGDFEAAEIGTYLVNVSYDPPARDGAGDDERAPPVTETTGISLSYSPEYADMGANLELIRQLAGVTPHGRVLTGDAEVDNVFRHDLPPNVVLLPAWQRLMWWALVLFLFDIVLRRVLVSWADVWRRLQLAAAKVLPPVGRYLRPAVSLPGGADVTVAQHRATMEGVSNKRRDELLASLDAEDVEGERRRPSADTGGESAAAPPKPPATNYTSRLLNAKKKATGGKSGSDDAS